MRKTIVVLSMLLGLAAPAVAQLSIGIATPGVSIGINVPLYPELVRVPGYPVYYAPGLQSNFFFYDGLYWVYEGDNWYASSWYNGPWGLVSPQAVPLFVLRIPVRYYRSPPQYFRGWQPDRPPRWGEHWGNEWQQQHRDWDRWDRRTAPPPAPRPVYQRPYAQDRYPHVEQQRSIQDRNYRYQPRDPVVRQHFTQPAPPRAAQPAPPRAAQPGRPVQHDAGPRRVAPVEPHGKPVPPGQQHKAEKDKDRGRDEERGQDHKK